MDEIQKPKVKRLSVDLPEEYHRDIKTRASDQKISIKKYIMDAIFEKMRKERE